MRVSPPGTSRHPEGMIRILEKPQGGALTQLFVVHKAAERRLTQLLIRHDAAVLALCNKPLLDRSALLDHWSRRLSPWGAPSG
jgi:hypothetical protein